MKYVHAQKASHAPAEEGKEKKDSAEIIPSDDVIPVEGRTPNFTRYEIPGARGWNCRWTDNTENKGMSASDTFKAGHSYSLAFYIKPDASWEWKEKSDGFADVTVKLYTDAKRENYILADRPQLSYEQDGTKLLPSFFFECKAPAAAEKIAVVVIAISLIRRPNCLE